MNYFASKGKIYCLCNYRGIGGAQMNASLMAEEFEKRGFESHVIFLCEREMDYIPNGSFEVILSSKKINLFNVWRLVRRLFVVFRSGKPVAVYGFQPAANAFGSLISKFTSKSKFIATQRNPSDKQSRLGRLLDKIIGSSSFYDANIAVSNVVKDSYKDHGSRYHSKMITVHNGTPVLESANIGREQAREMFSMPAGATILGVVARLHPQKNIGFALSILPEMPNALLYVAGDGPEEGYLKKLAEELGVADRVNFLGSLKGQKLTAFYNAMDVFLMTSIYEGFGRTIVEALSQGLPVVANDIPIAREVAGPVGRYAALEVAQWKQAILDVLRDHDPEASVNWAKKFSIDQMAVSYLKAAKLIS